MSVLDSLKKYNISSYIERAQSLDRKLKSCVDRLDGEYRTKMQEVESLERTIREDSTRQTYIQQQDSLKKIHVNFTNVEFPVSEIEQLKFEIEKLREAISQIESIEKELSKVANHGLIGSIAASALKEIRQFNISSLDDVNKLLIRVQEHLGEIRNLKFQQQSKERSDQIALLNGILKSCSQLREYLISQPYEATNNRSEIVETANRVLGIYSELDINDENFTVNKKRVIEICEAIADLKLPWSSLSRVDTIDEEMAAAMAKAGCIELKFGFESGSDTMLQLMNKRATVAQAQRAIDICYRNGIKVKGFLIHGFPGENETTTSETINFINKNKEKIDRVSLFRWTPLPGSYVYDNADKYGLDCSKLTFENAIIYSDIKQWFIDDEINKMLDKQYLRLKDCVETFKR